MYWQWIGDWVTHIYSAKNRHIHSARGRQILGDGVRQGVSALLLNYLVPGID